MAKVVLKNNHLHFNGTNYFRRDSEDVTLGAIGEKRTPVFGANSIEVHSEIDSRDLTVRKATVVDIDTRRTLKSTLDSLVTLNFKVFGGSLDERSAYEHFKSAQLKLVKLGVRSNDLVEAANADPDALEDLRDYGRRARVVSEVWIVVSAHIASRIENSKNMKLSFKGKFPVVKLDAASDGGAKAKKVDEIELSEGTCLAYMLSAPEWSRRRRRRRRRERRRPTVIEEFNEDPWGIN